MEAPGLPTPPIEAMIQTPTPDCTVDAPCLIEAAAGQSCDLNQRIGTVTVSGAPGDQWLSWGVAEGPSPYVAAPVFEDGTCRHHTDPFLPFFACQPFCEIDEICTEAGCAEPPPFPEPRTDTSLVVTARHRVRHGRRAQ